VEGEGEYRIFRYPITLSKNNKVEQYIRKKT